jgi:hypothetical protein
VTLLPIVHIVEPTIKNHVTPASGTIVTRMLCRAEVLISCVSSRWKLLSCRVGHVSCTHCGLVHWLLMIAAKLILPDCSNFLLMAFGSATFPPSSLLRCFDAWCCLQELQALCIPGASSPGHQQICLHVLEALVSEFSLVTASALGLSWEVHDTCRCGEGGESTELALISPCWLLCIMCCYICIF